MKSHTNRLQESSFARTPDIPSTDPGFRAEDQMREAPQPESTAPVDSAADQHAEASDPFDAARQIPQLLRELQSHASYFIAVQKELATTRVRNLVLKAVLGVLGLIAGTAVIITAVVLLLVGAANGLGALFGGRNWLGYLIMGVLILGGLAAVVGIGMRRIKRSAREQTVSRLEQRKEAQRQQFNHTATERAGAVPLRAAEAETSDMRSP